MAKDSDPLAGVFETEESGGILAGLLAEETEIDGRMMWRLGWWGATALGAVIVAVLANQAQLGWRRDQIAAADVARQSERLHLLTRESQNETRRLASAIETLNTDRDRLYSRVTVLEQGLDSVTGAIARQSAASARPDPQTAAAPQPPSSAPGVAPVASIPTQTGDRPRADAARDEPTRDPSSRDSLSPEASKEASKDQATKDPTPSPHSAAAASLVPSAAAPSGPPMTPLVASRSIMSPPDPAAAKLMQPAKPQAEAAPPAELATASPPIETEAVEENVAAPAPVITIQQTRFAIDLGSASSVDGLRAMWRGLIKSNPELATLRPIIMIKEARTALGMQLRLGAGPLVSAAAAAKYCATLIESERSCDTTVFDGQRLSMKGQDAGPQPDTAPAGSARSDAKSEAKFEAKSEARPENKPENKPETRPDRHRRSHSTKRTKREEPVPPQSAPAKPETTSTLSSFFRRQ